MRVIVQAIKVIDYENNKVLTRDTVADFMSCHQTALMSCL